MDHKVQIFRKVNYENFLICIINMILKYMHQSQKLLECARAMMWVTIVGN